MAEAAERAVIKQFRAERVDEYRELCSGLPAFVEEIEVERRRGPSDDGHESEADLDRFRTWLNRIRARDYFDAEGHEDAEAEVARCAEIADADGRGGSRLLNLLLRLAGEKLVRDMASIG